KNRGMSSPPAELPKTPRDSVPLLRYCQGFSVGSISLAPARFGRVGRGSTGICYPPELLNTLLERHALPIGFALSESKQNKGRHQETGNPNQVRPSLLLAPVWALAGNVPYSALQIGSRYKKTNETPMATQRR